MSETPTPSGVLYENVVVKPVRILALAAAALIAAPVAAAGAAAPPVDLTGPSAQTNNPMPVFAFSSADPTAVFTCTLSGPGGTIAMNPACTSPVQALAEGAYVFTVQATGDEGTAQASLQFTVDTTPPALPALSGTPQAFTFSSEPEATFACALDGPSGPGTFAPCTSPQSYPGLPPGAYTLRVHAIDAAGNAGPDASLGFTVAAPPPPLPTATPSPLPTATPTPPPPAPLRSPPALRPVFHVAVVARPGLADVRVRLPGSARYSALSADRALPLGSVIDTRRGAVQLLTLSRRGGKAQRATFDGGVFRVTQPGAATVLTLIGPCRPARRLAGNGHGAFVVRGTYSSTTVRGTRWEVDDTCSGTLTRVLEGVVQVRDQARGRTVLVRAGRRYLARPKRR